MAYNSSSSFSNFFLVTVNGISEFWSQDWIIVLETASGCQTLNAPPEARGSLGINWNWQFDSLNIS